MSKNINNINSNLIFEEMFILSIPIVSIIFFNYLKKKIFTGNMINYIDFLFQFYGIFIIFYCFNIHQKTTETKQSNPTQYDSTHFTNSVFYSLLIIFIINGLMLLNPCKNYLTDQQYNIIYIFLLFIIYSILKNFINLNNQYNYINKKYKKYYKYFNVILLMLNIFLIYNKF
jgi:hypothetical protein